ncbi:MAG TPA: 30S ribosomal protein S17 [Candidatus Omnitrophota bacterium]|nr:30S ribosomal protein S17 [Candidatus Omnitrophota bacterium]
MKTEMKEIGKMKTPEIAGAICNDIDCPTHGNLSVRGRTFKGKVIKKFHKRIVIEFERTVYLGKFERYAKLKTKLHARLPLCMDKEINIGDYVRITECRPLSKLIHFVVTEKINAEENKK